MKKLLLICLALPLALSATAQEQKSKVLALYFADEMVAKEHFVKLDGQWVYKFENTNDTQLEVQLMKIFKPRVSTNAYAIIGKIKYDNVQGEGYLEMWNFFPPVHPGMPEGQYFSRTLGESGEMGKITGTCDWRDFSLPFDSTGASGPPTRLEINLILPGRGTVYITPVKLLKYSSGFLSGSSSSGGSSNPTVAAGWWSPRLSAIFGGIGGSLFGCFGALIGCLAGIGKARRFVLAMTKVLTALGILLTIGGIVAVACRQPYAVWYPLTLLGVISAAVCGANLPAIKKRYEDLEIRRMTSMDATGR